MKHNKIYTINLDEETSEKLQALARVNQRKVAELLRLFINPIIDKEWLLIQNELHPENQQAQMVAHFTPSTLDKLPKL